MKIATSTWTCIESKKGGGETCDGRKEKGGHRWGEAISITVFYHDNPCAFFKGEWTNIGRSKKNIIQETVNHKRKGA